MPNQPSTRKIPIPPEFREPSAGWSRWWRAGRHTPPMEISRRRHESLNRLAQSISNWVAQADRDVEGRRSDGLQRPTDERRGD